MQRHAPNILLEQVLPVGGVREKLLAAHRHGIRELIIPRDNARDLEKLDDDVRDGLTIHQVGHVSEVLAKVLPKLKNASKPAA